MCLSGSGVSKNGNFFRCVCCFLAVIFVGKDILFVFMKRFYLLFFVGWLLFSVSVFGERSASFVVDTSRVYQSIYGFGGVGMNGQWANVYTEEKVDMLWGANGLGLNIMRIRVNPTESNWGEYVNAVKWGKARGATIMATPWTPPYRFKVDAEQTYGDSSNHGSINTDSIDSYAQWLERYRAYMEASGAALDIISMQNECDYDPAGYEGCAFSESEMALMVTAARKYLSEDCLVMAPECFGWGGHTYNRNLVSVAAARKNIDVWGNHIYGATDLTYVPYVSQLTGKQVWMTEYCYDDDEVGTWDNTCTFVESIDSCMRGGFSAYIYYNMINNMFGDCVGGGNTSSYSTMGYVFGHYGRYATGKRRIASSVSDGGGSPVVGSAYMNDWGDTIAVFVLNHSEDSVLLSVGLPFEAKQVVSVLTNESRGLYVQDMSERYGGSSSPEVCLLPETFYTFLFVSTEAEEVDEVEDVAAAKPYKSVSECNPINPYWFCGDPTGIEFDGRLYVYGTNDQQQYDVTGGLSSNSYGYIKSFVVMSTVDLVNWTFHGTIDMSSVCGGWMYASWAPSIVSREEEDGLTHFYMYFSNSGGGIGVVTSTSPLGPWSDPLGRSLISGSTEGLGLCSSPFDPGAVIDSDGVGWLAFGGGSPNEEGSDIFPGNARIVQLGEDMISLASDIVRIAAPYHFEANELNVIGGKYVYSYCTNWRARDEWSSYSSTIDEPSSCSICYMTSATPLDSSSWSYKGEYLSNPGAYGFNYSNNHSHLQKYGSLYYLLYHTTALEADMGMNGGYRSIAMNKATVVERSQRISLVSASSTGVSQLTANRVDAFAEQQAETVCTAAEVSAENADGLGNTVITTSTPGAWMMVKGVQFGSNGPASFTAKIQGSGRLEVRLDDVDAEPVVCLDFDSDELEEVSVDCDSLFTSVHTLYLFFSKASGVKFDWWRFDEVETTGVEALSSGDRVVVRDEYYTVGGVLLSEKPLWGVYIRRMYFDDGSVEIIKGVN